MKTIGKKLKAIYVMAVIAFVSLCMSFIPLMTNTVKANTEATATNGLRITGAQVKTIDGATQEDGKSQFAVYFHTEITEEFYGSIKTEDNSVQFGMIVGPKTMIEGLKGNTALTTEAFDEAVGQVVTNGALTDFNKAANFRFVGDGLLEEVAFTNGVKTFEAGVVFDEEYLLAEGEKYGAPNVLQLAAAEKLSAIPYYVVDGTVTMNASDEVVRAAKDVLVETVARVSVGASDSLITDAMLEKYVGEVEVVAGEYYWDKSVSNLYVANVENELVQADISAFNDGCVDYVVAGVPNGGVMSEFVDGSVIGIAFTYADGSVKVIPVKVVTKIFFSGEDFFVDANEDGTLAATEYVFPSNGTTAPYGYDGYYVLANNIDLTGYSTYASNTSNAFEGTFDGRGFALSNISIGRRDGLFGTLRGATIKNIAFDGFKVTCNDECNVLMARYTYGSTFENVYVRALPYNMQAHTYVSDSNRNAFGSLIDNNGVSTFTNVVYDNTASITAVNGQKQSRIFFGDNATAKYENVSVIGLPTNVKTEKYDDTNYTLVLTLPQSTIESFGATAGTVYALTDAVVADDVAVIYANLIDGIEKGELGGVSADVIKYVKLVADTVAERGYYVDLATLGKDTTVAEEYAQTGCWLKAGDELVWASLADTSKVTVEAENEQFKDSTTVKMYYNGVELEGATLSVSAEDAELVEINGNVIARKADVNVSADTQITVTVSYLGLTKTINLTLLFDIDKVETYESGEFIIDKSTGKVFKANANGELVAYNATSYLGNETTVTVNGVEQTLANAKLLAFETAGLATLTAGNKYLIVAGQNALVAKVVTKVLFSSADFFVDANSDGTLAATEYIFPSNGTTAPYGYDGYYVLANNIDLTGAAVYSSNTTDAFTGTFDGRGFALSNIELWSRNGMFGKLDGATIKNIAFDGFKITKNDECYVLTSRYTFNSTFENVYVRALPYNMQAHAYVSNSNRNAFGRLDNTNGVSTFTNVVYDNTASITAVNGQKQSRVFFGDDATATYNNVSVVGLPTMVTTATHESANKMVLTLPLATIKTFVEEPGVYALADCGTAKDVYKNLIDGIEKGEFGGIDTNVIQYIEFVADAVAERGYYVDLASLGASADASEYTATGYWKVSGGALAWTSLAGKAHVYEAVITEKTCTQDGYTTYTCTCGCGDSYVLDFVPAGHVLDESGEFCTVCGEYAGDKNIVDTAEFVIDKATGKVFKADADNKLVAYDATSFLNGETAVTVGGVAQTLAGEATTFAFEKANLETLSDGNKYLIVAGDNAIIAQVVTKVISTLNDFFVDTTDDGVGDIAAANYIFYQGTSITTLYNGYYVLANNIAMERKEIRACNNDIRPSLSTTLGFQGTFDGRGFALSDISIYGSAGMFGTMHNATIKNLAVTDVHLEGNDSAVMVFARATSNVTVENVYVKMDRARAYAGNYVNYPTIFNGITGTCTFTNVVIENTTGMTMTTDNVKAYATYMDTNGNSVYVNTSIVGVPSNVAWSKDANGVWNTLTMYLPSSELTKLGVSAGQYSIGATELAALEAQYTHLIAGIEKAKGIDITIINLVEDTSGRAYYVDNATLSASTAANGYVATGYWKVVDNALVWASLA